MITHPGPAAASLIPHNNPSTGPHHHVRTRTDARLVIGYYVRRRLHGRLVIRHNGYVSCEHQARDVRRPLTRRRGTAVT
jgi:hypothetical protein